MICEPYLSKIVKAADKWSAKPGDYLVLDPSWSCVAIVPNAHRRACSPNSLGAYELARKEAAAIRGHLVRVGGGSQRWFGLVPVRYEAQEARGGLVVLVGASKLFLPFLPTREAQDERHVVAVDAHLILGEEPPRKILVATVRVEGDDGEVPIDAHGPPVEFSDFEHATIDGVRAPS